MRSRITALCCACALSAQAFGDDVGEANRLMIDAVRAVESVQGETDVQQRYERLKRALAKLTEIVEEHPSTDLAVRLITGQAVGGVSLDAVETRIEEEKRKIDSANAQVRLREARRKCFVDEDVPCLLFEATSLTFEVDTYVHDELLGDIARAYGRLGDIEAALRTAAMADDAEARRLIAYAAAETRVQAGDLEGALAIAAKAAEKWGSKYLALSAVAQAQARAGDLEGAVTTFDAAVTAAEGVGYTRSSRTSVLGEIAQARAAVGDRAGAFRTYSASVETDDTRGGLAISQSTRTLTAIARALAKAGDIEGAEEAMEAITARHPKDQARMAIAQARAKARGEDVQVAPVAGAQARAAYAQVKAYAHAGDVSSALASAATIDDVDDRRTTLRVLATDRARAGDTEGALASASAVRHEQHRDSILADVAIELAKGGWIEAAFGIAGRVGTSGHTFAEYAWSGIAKAQAARGDLAGAIETVAGIADRLSAEQALGAIAQAQAEAGRTEEAFETFSKIEDPVVGARLLVALADRAAKQKPR